MNRAEVMIWARRICANRNAEPHAMLEISHDADLGAAQAAYHAIAKVAHPDLHRRSANPEELELVTTAFSLVASAYHTFRQQRRETTKMAKLDKSMIPARSQSLPKVTTDANRPATADEPAELLPERAPSPNAPAPQMNPRALIHYRKAEQSLRRGDIPQAVLHLRMAITTDPTSTFLRQALKEVESELAKKP